MSGLGDALGYIASSIDKPGRAVRGVLAGKPQEALAALPFSDTLGLTDPSNRVSGRQLTDRLGITRAGDQGWGSHALGFGAELATDPLNWMPAGYGAHLLNRAGKFDRLGDAIGRFGAGEAGYLKFAPEGIPSGLANAADAIGPMYPGGVGKIRALAGNEAVSRPHSYSLSQSHASSLLGSSLHPEMHDPSFLNWLAQQRSKNSADYAEQQWIKDIARGAQNTPEIVRQRLESIARHQSAERLAGEIPQGSEFLGAGAEALAIRTPDGGVIRIADNPIRADRRPDIPEVLQPYRATQIGPYHVEHLPQVSPVGIADPGVFDISDAMRQSLISRGLDPWDVAVHNLSRTTEGRFLVHDGGAISGHNYAGRPTYPVPDDSTVRRILDLGGPESVRVSLSRGIAHGTRGQGVGYPLLSPGVIR